MASTFSPPVFLSRHVLGVRARRTIEENKGVFFADLVVTDGYFSNLCSVVMDSDALKKHAVIRGNLLGGILKDATLPIPQHGTMAPIKGHGPALFYQTGT
jgi:squalene monooxygenase